MALNFIDIVFLIIVFLLAVKGGISGLIEEIFSIVALLGGIVIASINFSYGSQFFMQHLGPSGKWNDYLGFFFIFIISFIFLKLIGFLIKKMIMSLHLQTLDHVLGFVFGAIEGILVIFLIYYFLISQPILPSEKIFSTSSLAKYLGENLHFLIDLLPDIKGLQGKNV